MKKLFIYFSLSGNGEVVAKQLEAKGYEIRRVFKKGQKANKKPGFFTIFRGGFRAGMNKKDKLEPYDTNIEGYDEIVIGSPIWNSKFSCPINRVLADLNLKDKKLSFIFYSGSGTAEKAVERVSKEYPDSKIIILKEPKKYEDELFKIIL